MVLLFLLLLGSIPTQLPAMNKRRTFPRSPESILARQRLLEVTREAAAIFSQPESISTQDDATTAELLQEQLHTLEIGESATIALPAAAIPMALTTVAPTESALPTVTREQTNQIVEEKQKQNGDDDFFAPLFAEDEDEKQTAEAPAEEQPVMPAIKEAAPTAATLPENKVSSAPQITKERTTSTEQATTDLPATAAPAQQTTAQRTPLIPSDPITPATQQFITQFTIAARASSFGAALAAALHAEPGASAQAVDTALQLFFNAWATTLYQTSQTLVTNVQTELSGCTGSWVGGFCYSCYNPAWRITIEQQARNQRAHDILTQLQTAADRAQLAAEAQSPGQAAAVKAMITALHKQLVAHDATTQAPRAHQFVALAEQQLRSRASNIGRYIILHRKQAAVLTVGLLLALGYFWHRRRQNRQDYY